MSITNVQSVDDIRSGFPHPTIPPIDGEPTYQSIKKLHDLLKSNAASVPTNLGGGLHGHLGLTLAPILYVAVTGVNFNRPAHPGAGPVMPNQNPTQAQILAATRQYNTDMKTFLECERTDQALKQQLLGAVDPIYVESLRNMYTGYTAVPVLTILTHLYDNYGQITAMDLDENERMMKQRYDPNQPIDILFKQIEMAVEFATTGNSPFTARQIVNTAFILVYATGVYDEECRDWKRRAVATQTWANFKTDFMTAYKNRRELQKLRNQGSAAQLFGANAMESDSYHSDAPSATETSTITDFYSDTTDKITAIANATIESGTQVANLARDNQSLRAQVASMQELLKTMQGTILGNNNTTPSTSTSSTTSSTQPSASGGRGRGTGRGAATQRRRQPRGYEANSTHYCWSHGLTRTPHHVSATCRDPEPGHKRDATFNNRMGGSNFRCHLANNASNHNNE